MSFLSPRNTLQPLNMPDSDSLISKENTKARAILTSNVNERSRRDSVMKPLPLNPGVSSTIVLTEANHDIKSNDSKNEFDLYAPFGKTF